MIEQMGKVTSRRSWRSLGAGAALANPGAFIPIALKDISELDPSAAQYIVRVGLLLARLAAAARDGARAAARRPRLDGPRARLSGPGSSARADVAAAILVLLAVSLLRNGIAGLTG